MKFQLWLLYVGYFVRSSSCSCSGFQTLGVHFGNMYVYNECFIVAILTALWVVSYHIRLHDAGTNRLMFLNGIYVSMTFPVCIFFGCGLRSSFSG